MSPDSGVHVEDREKIFNQVIRPDTQMPKSAIKINEVSKRENSNEKHILEDDIYAVVSHRSKKSDQTHQRIKSDAVSLPAHLKSLIEYKSTQKLSEM